MTKFPIGWSFLAIHYIGDQGAARFAETLKVNETLTKLNLSWNDISYSCTACLADAFKVITAQTELDLSFNDIAEDGFPCLVDALQRNTVQNVAVDSLYFRHKT